MMIPLTVAQLRNVLQLPERPYEDVRDYDGSLYYNLTEREVCTVLSVQAQVASSMVPLTLGADYNLTASCIDFSPSGRKPDLNSTFVVDYTYSRLSGPSASTAVANAQLLAQIDFGADYKYGQQTPQGVNYTDLATFGAALLAASEAAFTLQSTEIEIAEKTRRGSVLFDDSKKNEDWKSVAENYAARYKRYKKMIQGPRSIFERITRSDSVLVFNGFSSDVISDFGLSCLLADTNLGMIM